MYMTASNQCLVFPPSLQPIQCRDWACTPVCLCLPSPNSLTANMSWSLARSLPEPSEPWAGFTVFTVFTVELSVDRLLKDSTKDEGMDQTGLDPTQLVQIRAPPVAPRERRGSPERQKQKMMRKALQVGLDNDSADSTANRTPQWLIMARMISWAPFTTPVRLKRNGIPEEPWLVGKLLRFWVLPVTWHGCISFVPSGHVHTRFYLP